MIIRDKKRKRYVYVWNWIQKFSLYPVYKKENSVFIIDENILQIDNHIIGYEFVIEPVHKSVLSIYISDEKTYVCIKEFH